MQTPDNPANPTLYLVFAGYHGQARRGCGDLVAAIASQREAQEAFRRVRMQIPNCEGWAELTAVSASGKVKRLGWFGRDVRLGKSPAAWALEARTPPPKAGPASPRRSWGARRGRSIAEVDRGRRRGPGGNVAATVGAGALPLKSRSKEGGRSNGG